MKINGISIGEKYDPCFIIAEAGVNHNGNIDLAKELIHAAYEAGADAVKFQTFNVKELLSTNAPKVGYQLKNTDKNESQEKMLEKLELRFDDFIDLKELCDKLDIIFLSTPFDGESALFLRDLNIDAFKIPSSEIINLPFLKLIASFNKPIILSTGMCGLQEIEKAINAIGNREQLALLHCESNYPANIDTANLRAMLTMKNAFQTIVGYSDHTPGITIPIAAVAMGASIIEKHFTLDKSMEGPDHKASLEPDELKKMVEEIRIVEEALGDGLKRPTLDELKTAQALRKSIVASEDLEIGTPLSKYNICFKRPGTGYPPEAFEYIEGLIVRRKVKKNQLITKEDL